ncbi:tetratricopeptide repeat protein [Thioalkalivibrio sp. ALJ16]|uniref:tetratricopeptide repeat protein n=1 Tax=Thioalkalivibrio sp. ALJ16 TaxID=1158762 RepID=UPI00036AE3AF|nr:tetratricopeptide repeat protein [Thioalkalivibrio sp. ALJ16]
MIEDWFWLLLPIAAASGWWLARYGIPEDREEQEPSLDRYLEGVRHLLDDRTDDALQAFIEMVEVDHETFETHVILGRLFRRRGEVDRAIRIHQNLVARPTLSPAHRAQALCELGEDFLLAGVLDRAEAVFRELVDSPHQAVPALDGLRQVYETQREWERAIEVGDRLKTHGVAHEDQRIAHYYCELAQTALEKGDWQAASGFADRAQAIVPRLSRALLIQSEIAARKGEVREAITLGRDAVARTPQLAPLLVPRLERLHQELPGENRLAQLEEVLDDLARNRGITMARIALMRLYRRTQRLDAALAELGMILAQRPVPTSGLLEAVRWMKILPAVQPYSTEFAAFEKALADQLGSQHLYQCVNCGYQGRAHVWQCPSCRRWDTLRGLDFDIDQSTEAAEEALIREGNPNP